MPGRREYEVLLWKSLCRFRMGCPRSQLYPKSVATINVMIWRWNMVIDPVCEMNVEPDKAVVISS